MSNQQMSKVWTVVGLFLLYYALNTWIVTQGGQEIFGAKLIVSNRAPAAMWGIPIICIALFLNSIVGTHYARRTGPNWHERVPIVGFDNISSGTREGRFYQGSMLALLSLLPAVALLHFWRLFLSANVVTTEKPPREASSIWDWSALTTLNDPARICTDLVREGGIPSCMKNATILPGLEPTFFALLTIAAAIAFIKHWRAIFRR
ncbi:hypothetical protein SAMN05216573_10516 [Bradyrhizobium sp. Rc3b]|uniref:hypothetical protein n=1 Tax=Bradyrhizobium sp. Rc3b TaxID=1855322 RepID=UPI0008E3642B|nr:hypothetical protein [Bradyrhizobium sp. Rc3b]SFM85547.1 hypothetical protein SAMN05216573_10516 [Bradyrhizobium sp. Rc3b]